MSALVIIWLVSLASAGTALAIMFVLILARLFAARSGRQRATRRQALVSELLGADKTGAARLSQVPPDLLMEVFSDLFRLVRGQERNAFVAQAIELGLPERLARQARRGPPRERVVAARALAPFRDETSIAALRESLQDRDEDVRLAAALALAEAGGTQEIHDLVDILGLGTAENSMLMVTLFRTIAEQRPEEIKALALEPAVNTRARLAAIEALSTTGDFSLVPTIVRLAVHAKDGSPELPRYLRALGALGHPAAKPAVLRGLDRSDPEARAEAAEAAGRIGMVEAIERLAELLDDPDWWVRFRAGEALVRLRPDGVEQMRRIARVGSPRAMEAATTVLAENGLAA